MSEPEIRVWATVDGEGPFSEMADGAARCRDLVKWGGIADQCCEGVTISFYKDGGYQQVSVTGLYNTMSVILSGLYSQDGHFSWTVDAPNDKVADQLERCMPEGVIGELDIEDDLEEGDDEG